MTYVLADQHEKWMFPKKIEHMGMKIWLSSYPLKRTGVLASRYSYCVWKLADVQPNCFQQMPHFCVPQSSLLNPILTFLSRGKSSFSLNHHVASSSNTLCSSWIDRCPIVWLVHLCWEDPCLEQGEPGLNELQMFSLCCPQIWFACAGLHRQNVSGPRLADPADKRHRLLETHSYFPERSQRVQGEWYYILWLYYDP